MAFKKYRLADFFRDSRDALTNTRDNLRLRTLLDGLNVDDARFQEGFDLLDAAERSQITKQEKNAAQIKARKELYEIFDAAHESFSVHAKFTKIAYRKQPEKLRELGIDKAIACKSNINAWLTQTKFYYSHAVPDTELHPLLERNGTTLQNLQDNDQNVQLVEKANQKYRIAIGEAQAAREARDKDIEDFRFWMFEFIAVCREATKDEPQLLEALKITVYSKGYKKKKLLDESEEPTVPTVPAESEVPAQVTAQTPEATAQVVGG